MHNEDVQQYIKVKPRLIKTKQDKQNKKPHIATLPPQQLISLEYLKKLAFLTYVRKRPQTLINAVDLPWRVLFSPT